MYEEYYRPEDVKVRLLGYEKHAKQVITFLKDTYNEDSYQNNLTNMKSNHKIHKIVKIENGEEEVILDKNNI